MTTEKIIDEISQVARFLWEKGWAERNAGNISVNITSLISDVDPDIFTALPSEKLNVIRPLLAGQFFIITPTGSRMRELNRNTMDKLCFLRISDDGESYSHVPPAFFESLFPVSGTGYVDKNILVDQNHVYPQPSSELPSHLSIHEMLLEKKTGTRAVIHTHVTELIALTQIREFTSAEAINRLLWGMHPETAMFVPEGSGFVPYEVPGTDSIASATVRELVDHQLVIWEKHGVFATGHSVTEAFDTIDIMAKAAKIYFMVKQTGETPAGLTDNEIRKIRKV